MRIGAHIHTSGGMETAARYAADTGCECVQVFAKSPQSWHGPLKSADEVAAFLRALGELGIGPVFTHATYLINLGSEDDALWSRSGAALADELVRAAAFEAAGVVVHMGTAYGTGRAENAARVGEAVADAWRAAAAVCDPPPVLLENAAGAGRSYGRTPVQLCDALEASRALGADAGLCLDTCHGFAAGWDLRGPDGWADLCDALDERGHLGAVGLIHANDCKGELGEHRDRHAWIGEGGVGTAGFEAMFGETRLHDVAVVVEMPGDPPVKDAENVARLRSLRDAAGAGGGPGRGDV